MAIPFFERPGGIEIKKYVDKGILTSLAVWQIDRLGRDLRDIINTIHYFNERKIGISFVSQGLSTLGPDGKENPISKMIISILGVVGEMERVQIKERRIEGIKIGLAFAWWPSGATSSFSCRRWCWWNLCRSGG